MKTPISVGDPVQASFVMAFVFVGWLISFVGATFSQAAEGTLKIHAENILTAEGKAFGPGQVHVEDGKITYVGPLPKSVTDQDEASQDVIQVHTLMPGLVNAASNAGLVGGQAELSREVTPDFDTLSAIDWSARDFSEARDAGVTTVQVLPATDSVFCGFSCVVKTAGEEDQRVLASENAVVMAVCSDPTSRNRSRSRPDSIYVRQPTNRMGVVWIIRNSLHQALRGERAVGLDSKTQTILEDLLAGKRKVISVSRTDFDIRSALDLGNEYGFQPTIYGGDEIYRIVDEFQQSGAKLVYNALTTGSTSRALRGSEGTELRWNVPGTLEDAGIDFCLAGDELLEQARFATRFGLSPELALQAVTILPAKLIGLDAQIGSIAVGKHADLLALSGDPLQVTSAIEWTMVDGMIYGNNESKE